MKFKQLFILSFLFGCAHVKVEDLGEMNRFDPRFPLSPIRKEIDEKSLRCSFLPLQETKALRGRPATEILDYLEKASFETEGALIEKYSQALIQYDTQQDYDRSTLLMADFALFQAACGLNEVNVFNLLQDTLESKKIAVISQKRILQIAQKSFELNHSNSGSMLQILHDIRILDLLVSKKLLQSYPDYKHDMKKLWSDFNAWVGSHKGAWDRPIDIDSSKDPKFRAWMIAEIKPIKNYVKGIAIFKERLKKIYEQLPANK